jgi:pimeloyl-ACP methyl ester carboxylesterase
MFARVTTQPSTAMPVLLLHGWTASADTNWFPVFAALDGERPLVAPDHRGHGRGLRPEAPFSLEACADDAAGVLRQLGIRRAIVAGYSMGGPIALLLAQRHEELVAGLVLGATALEWRASLWERAVWRLLGVWEAVARLGGGERAVRRYLRDAVEDNPDLAPVRAWLEGEARRATPADIAQAGKALSVFDARSFAGLLDVPTAVVLTTRDRLVRPRKQRRLGDATRAKLFELDGDHDVPLMKPKEFGEVMRDAIAWVAAAAAPR